MMEASDLLALLPFLVLLAAILLVLGLAAFRRGRRGATALALGGLALAFGSLFWAASGVPRRVTALLEVDSFSLFYMGIIIAAAFFVVLLGDGYLRRRGGPREEFLLLVLIATLGAAALVASSHFASLFLGLEVLSVSLYVLISYLRAEDRALEAGLKYLILTSTSSAFLLFGAALVYAVAGTLDFGALAVPRSAGGAFEDTLFHAGVALTLTGLGFKLAVAPFHLWTPDVYEGAPAPVTAFVATVSKGAVVALLLRYGGPAGLREQPGLYLALAAIAGVSMLAGNLLALFQENVKRLLAYSSIAHLGYVLVAFLAGGELGARAVGFYLVAYFITTLGALGVVGALSRGESDCDRLAEYRGLFWRRPALAAGFTASLLSLAGIPLTAGFIGKFTLLAAGVGSALWVLVFLLVAGSAVGIFYYLRLTVTLYLPADDTERDLPPPEAPGSLALALLFTALILLGIYPAPLFDVIDAAAGG
jgi:NADH-quinone oxidoreductase subunit N